MTTAIRAAIVNPDSGVVENVIVVRQEDIDRDPTLLIIPKITSKDGSLSYDLGVNIAEHRWDGFKFTDLNKVTLDFDAAVQKKINDYDTLQETEQVAPEVI